MSLSASPRSSMPDAPTRQQLDELDALLKRMLTLPVTPSGEEGGSLPELSPMPPPAQATAEPPAPEEGSMPESEPAAPPPASDEWTFAAPSLDTFNGIEPSFPDPQAIQEHEPAPVASPVPEPFTPEEQSPRWWVLPAVWVNESFDLCTIPLGRLGRWLRGARGRNLLGWLGLLLLAAAIAWIVLEAGLGLDLGRLTR